MFKIDPKYQPDTMLMANRIISTLADAKSPLKGRVSLFNNKGLIWVGTALKVAYLGLAIAAIYVVEKAKEFYFKKIKRVVPEDDHPISDIHRLFNEYDNVVPDSQNDSKRKLQAQVNADISRLRNEKEVRKNCRRFIQEENLFSNLKAKQPGMTEIQREEREHEKTEKYINQALSVYSSSYEHYAPVVVEWTHALLETALASEPPKRLVFMARDGTAPYKVAKFLKEKYPEKYGKVPISHVYTSRVLVTSSMKSENGKELFRKYLSDKGVKSGESLLFVDVGFTGSTINDIKSMLNPITDKVEFTYLVSLNEKCTGFMADYHNRLEAVPSAGSNLAIHWLEDTHQKVVNSPSHLVECELGKVRPNTKAGVKNEGDQVVFKGLKSNGHTKYEKLTCKESMPKSYLFKVMGFKAIMDYAAKSAPTPYLRGEAPAIAHRQADPASKAIFDQFLMLFRNQERRSIVKHV